MKMKVGGLLLLGCLPGLLALESTPTTNVDEGAPAEVTTKKTPKKHHRDLTGGGSGRVPGDGHFSLSLLSSNPGKCVAYRRPGDYATFENCRFGGVKTWWTHDHNRLLRSHDDPTSCLAWDTHHSRDFVKVRSCDPHDPAQIWTWSANRAKFQSNAQNDRDCLAWCDKCGTDMNLQVQSCRDIWNERQQFNVNFAGGGGGGDDYCHEIGDGCNVHADCCSAFCDDYDYTCRSPPRLGTPGDDCIRDGDCANHACGFEYGTNDISICCHSGETITWRGDPYCTEGANGAGCAIAGMCASGYCSDNGRCRDEPLRAPGDACQSDRYCESGACAYQYGATSGGGGGHSPSMCPLGPPPNGERPPRDDCQFEPTNPVKCGAPAYNCDYDNPCYASEAGFLVRTQCCQTPPRNTCTTNFQPVVCGDQECPYDNTCLAQASGFRLNQCRDAPSDPIDQQVCCPTRETFEWRGDDYCVMGNGEECAVDGMCASGYCSDNGRCRDEPLRNPGDSCRVDRECVSGACAYVYTSSQGDDGMTCCSSRDTFQWRGDDYCVMGNGEECAVDGMCEDDLVCTSGGFCRAPRPPVNDICRSDYDCADGYYCDAYGACVPGGGVADPPVRYTANFNAFGDFVLEIESDDSSMGWDANLANMDDLTSDSELDYFLGVQWTETYADFGIGPRECSPAITGATYDPTAVCGAGSAAKSTNACDNLDPYFRYRCPDKSCVVGDLSGKFGAIVVNNRGGALKSVEDDHDSASNDDYVHRTTSNSYDKFASVVFVDSYGDPVLCGKLNRLGH